MVGEFASYISNNGGIRVGIVFSREPHLEKPDMICSWPGIGNIGIIAVDTLKGQTLAEEFGEIEPWDFFEPRKVVIKNGLLEEMEFPTSKFYFRRLGAKDLIFFIGEEQPSSGKKMYGSGEKAYQMASLVIAVAQKYGCRRIYTSGACVSLIHHQVKPRVVAVASSEKLIREIKKYPNVALMSEIGEGGGEGIITGLNGLLLTVAKKKGMEAVCLMGEIPDWLSRTPLPYPKASKSVLEVFAEIFGVRIDFTLFNKQVAEIDKAIDSIYDRFPPQLKEQYDRRKSVVQPGPITKEEAEWMKEHLDDFLRTLSEKKGGEDENDEKPI